MPEARVRAQAPWFIRYVLNPLLLLTKSWPILTVRGRRSGREFRTPINVLEHGGAQYLISPRGETGWSRNVRVTGECQITIKGQTQRFKTIEIAPEERPPLIAAYLARWGNQTHGDFERLPDPIDHPAFRLEPVG
jgi:deazaflavin-dependent oxidoreductase (nitroreductase family)